MDGGVSGEFVRASTWHGGEDAEPGGAYTVGADGFSFSAADVARGAGLSQSQGSDFESGGEEEGFLYAAGFLSEDGGEWEVNLADFGGGIPTSHKGGEKWGTPGFLFYPLRARHAVLRTADSRGRLS